LETAEEKPALIEAVRRGRAEEALREHRGEEGRGGEGRGSG